jgi:hypothetical protein
MMMIKKRRTLLEEFVEQDDDKRSDDELDDEQETHAGTEVGRLAVQTGEDGDGGLAEGDDQGEDCWGRME